MESHSGPQSTVLAACSEAAFTISGSKALDQQVVQSKALSEEDPREKGASYGKLAVVSLPGPLAAYQERQYLPLFSLAGQGVMESEGDE